MKRAGVTTLAAMLLLAIPLVMLPVILMGRRLRGRLEQPEEPA